MEKKNEKIPYYEVAKQALMKWGNEESNWKGLSEAEADQIISTKSFDEIESQVYAKGSIDYAIEGIARAYERKNNEVLSEEDKKELSRYIYGGEKCGIIEDWKESISQSKKSGLYSPFIMSKFDEIIIDTLFTVHDGWVKDNAKKFNSREKKHQHMPSELIGWQEAKADLLFIRPIFEKAGIEVDEKRLEKVYNRRVREFLLKHDIKTEKDLAMLIAKGENFYPALAGYGDTLNDIKNPEIIVEKIIPQIEKNGIGKIRDVAEGIKSSQLRDKKEVLIEEIRKIIKKCDDFMEKTSDISEEDYLESNEILEAISQIEKLDSEVKKLKSKDKKIIEKVREKKKIAPLVPISEFVEGLSDLEFKALEKEIEEVDGIYNTFEYKTFLELKQKIEKLRDDYDKKIADAHHKEEAKFKKEHLKKLRKVLQDTIENASYEEEKSLGEYMIAHFRGDGNKILVSKAVNDLYRIFRIIPGSMDFERKKITETMNARLF